MKCTSLTSCGAILSRSWNGFLFRRRAAGALYEGVAPLPVAVLLDNVRSMYNVGRVLPHGGRGQRGEAVPLRDHRRSRPRSAITKTALGAEETVPWEHAWEPLPLVETVRGRGYEIAAVETSVHAVDLFDWTPRFPVLVIFGHEVDGIRPEISALCDTHVRIPMLGTKHSLNVATAGGVVIYELLRKYRGVELRYDETCLNHCPRLRLNLDFMPSPSPEHPGLFIRDPYQFSDAMLIIPPPLVECLQCFDGSQTDLDLRAALVRITGRAGRRSRLQQQPDRHAERAPAFWKTRRSERMQAERKREFAAAAGARTGACRVGVSRRSRRSARDDGGVHDGGVEAAGAGRAVRDRRAARESRGRLAIVPGGVRDAAAGAQGSHLRDSGDLALRRAGEVRADAQVASARRWATRGPTRRWWTGWPSAAARAWRWKTTATPSSTPWNCR